MYNINDHYNYILQYTKTKCQNLKLGYFFPFGSTNFENLEFIGPKNPKMLMLCFDQEPINYNYNLKTFSAFNKASSHLYTDNKTNIYSRLLDDTITFDFYILKFKKIPIILLSTEKDSDEKNKLLTELNYIDCYYFYHALAAADWFRGFRYCTDLIAIKERKIKKTFITYNRIIGNSRIYRALFISSLNRKKLTQSGHISFSKECPVHGNLEASIVDIVKKYNLDKNYIHNELQYISTLPDFRIDSSINDPIENSSFTIKDVNKPIESFVHVVTETCFWDKKKHLTEKIFKPIVLKQPFILLGCANNLSYLKEYGFKTFDRWWDESYDQCDDPIQRIDMVTKILEDLAKLSNHQLHKMLLEMEEILEYNYSLFYSQDFIDSIWNELKTNLDAAIAQASHPIVQETLVLPHHDNFSGKSPVLSQTDK